jgi:hypothetical protein
MIPACAGVSVLWGDRPISACSVEDSSRALVGKSAAPWKGCNFLRSREQLLSAIFALKFFQGAVRRVFWGISAEVRKRGKIATAPQKRFLTE